MKGWKRLLSIVSRKTVSSVLRIAIRLSPRAAIFHLANGEILSDLQQWAEAADAYRLAIERNPDLAWAHYRLGEALAKLERWNEASASFQRSAILNPGFCWAHYHLGATLAKQGQWDEAVTAYRTAIDLNPTFEWAYVQLTDILIVQSQWQEVEQTLEAGLAQCADDSILRFKKENIEAILAVQGDDNTSKETTVSGAIDVIVTLNEVNDRHGVGALLRRIFADDSHIYSIRSRNDYDGRHDFGQESICLRIAGLSRQHLCDEIINKLEIRNIRRVLCVPYTQDEILLALSIRKAFGTNLCTYIMDDQNIHAENIADELMLELLEKSSLRLAISPELRAAYEEKYRMKFWMLPPVVPPSLIRFQIQDSATYSRLCQAKTGVLIGNIWNKKWLDSLQETISGSGVRIDWYGAPNPHYLRFNKDELQQSGIILKGFVSEPELVKSLAKYPFTISPTGIGDDVENRPEIARLSLPSRLPYIAATSNTPIIVLGSEKTAAARFVERFQIGMACDYDSASFSAAIENICSPETQRTMRQNAIKLAGSLSADAIDQWIWKSLEQGEACDLRFEKLMPRLPTSRYVSDVGKSQSHYPE